MKDLCNIDVWKHGRQLQQSKWNNVHYIEKFNSILEDIDDDSVDIVYYKYDKHNTTSGVIHYVENTPIFKLFKFSPMGYYLHNYDYSTAWVNYPIDNSVVEKIKSIDSNKYKQNDKTIDFSFDYILFPLQSDPNNLPRNFDLKKLVDCMRWATKTKTHIVYKLHPFSTPESHVPRILKHLEDRGVVDQYNIVVSAEYNLDSLIDNSKAVWTFSSGAGFQSVLRGKPTVHFTEDIDIKTIALYATSPEEAATAKPIDEEIVARFISWYYTELTIDVDQSPAVLKDIVMDKISKFKSCNWDVTNIYGN